MVDDNVGDCGAFVGSCGRPDNRPFRHIGDLPSVCHRYVVVRCSVAVSAVSRVFRHLVCGASVCCDSLFRMAGHSGCGGRDARGVVVGIFISINKQLLPISLKSVLLHGGIHHLLVLLLHHCS